MAHMPLDAAMPQCVATPDPDLRCGSRWGVVHTHPQAERWAAQNLQRQGYEAYLPTHVVLRRDPVLRTLTRSVEAPLFTSYLFVAVPLTLWGPIRHTLGVRSLLMSGDRPSIVATALLDVLRAAEGVRRSVVAPGASWAPGMPCSPATGTPFAGHPAVVVSVTGQRAIIATVMFGELRQVSVDVSSLVARE